MFKREVTATLVSNVIGAVFSLGNAVILARVLGPAGWGLLGLALLIPAVTVTFCILGQDLVNVTFAGLYKDKRNSLFQQSLLITFFGAIIGVLVICAFYFWLPVAKGQFGKLSTNLILLICLLVPAELLNRLMISLVRGVGQVVTAAVINVVQGAVFLCLLVVFLAWRGGGLGVSLILVVLNYLVGVVMLLYVLREYVALRPSDFSSSLFKKSLVFGGQVSLATLASFLVYRIDQGILAFMVSAEQIGLYVVAVSLAERLRLLPGSISSAFLPRLANELSSRQPQVPVIFRYTTIISVVSMLLAAVVGAPAIFVLFGWDYQGSIPSFLLLLPGLAALGGASILYGDLAVREKPKYGMWAAYATLTINIVLNFLLIPIMGIAGASLASTVSYIFDCCMALLFYRHESKTMLREMLPRLRDCAYLFRVSVEMLKQLWRRLLDTRGVVRKLSNE